MNKVFEVYYIWPAMLWEYYFFFHSKTGIFKYVILLQIRNCKNVHHNIYFSTYIY